jgi:eukaryotic-like serine/threonine-protein kinase
MNEALARLTSALESRYRVERELGVGGMATVYLAHDVRHDRQVALKVLRADLAATLGTERFLREVRITASLNHPHILPLLDSGEVDGLLFYVMPYAEAGTLRDRLQRETQLGVESALEITKQVASALTYAHERGVLHRDIKPENILFQSGHAVVADFGIARAISAAGGETLTATGLALGTPAYMSPEQASGARELDERSDLYSLACVAYEMLVGERPFTGPTVQAVLARRLTESARPISATRPSVSSVVDRAIAKALAPVPADRFASVGEFASAIAQPAEVRRVGLGHVRPWQLLTAAVLAALVVGLWARSRFWGTGSPVAGTPRIAVLPFENLGAADDEPFAAGITDEITSRLAEISGLRVVSRTSAKRFAKRDMSVAELGKALDTDYILEGTLRTERTLGRPASARVSPQLVRVSDDVQIWQQRFDASLTPGAIFGIQADIAERVAAELRVSLAQPERARIAKIATNDSAAYRLYQLGRFHWDKRDKESLLRAIRYFGEAVARDSLFVDAYTGLAAASLAHGLLFTPDSASDVTRTARDAARRAVTLDASSAAAQAGFGFSLMVAEWDWAGADSAFSRAIAIDPDYGPARYWYTQLLWLQGKFSEALEQAQRAVAVDPLSTVAYLAHAKSLRFVGRRDESIAALKRSVELQSTMYLSYQELAEAYAQMGREQEAQQAARGYLTSAFPGRAIDESLVGAMVKISGGRAVASEIGHALDPIGMRPPQSQAASWFAFSGHRDSAFARLRNVVRLHSLDLFSVIPIVEPFLRSDSRWLPFLSSVHLDPR